MGNVSTADGARLPVLSAIERLKARSDVAATYPVYLDREWVDALNEAKAELDLAKARDAAFGPEQRRYDELKAQEPDKVLTFKFRALGPAEYEELLTRNRATAEQTERLKAAGNPFPPTWDTERFPLAMIAAALIEPELTEAEVKLLYDGDAFAEEGAAQRRKTLLNVVEFKELFNAALLATTSSPQVVA